mgnify:CR=1 FL=1
MGIALTIDYLILSIFASMAINSILRGYAKNKKILIDIPDRSRKFHKRPTPLTGGLGIYIALLISGKIYMDFNDLNGYLPEFTYHLMLSSIILVGAFLVDDIKGLKASSRLLIQILLSLYIIFTTDISLNNLGDLFGFGNIYLGIFSIPFTVFCVVGIMNAFNMIDGVNGLCSGYSMTSLLLIGFFSGLIYDSLMIMFIGSIVGFLFFNLSFFGNKRAVFLGDHGSNLLGFWVAWSAIYCSQNELYSIEPITIIWFVAIPLLDCVGLIYARTRQKISWASPGRDHIHHKLMNKFSSEGTLIIIISIALLSGLFAIYLEKNYSTWVSTLLFLVYSLVYYVYAYYFAHRAKNLGRGNV